MYGLAINNRAKFIHVSYSSDLALENSGKIKEAIESDFYQALWPMSLKIDSKSKRKWFNEFGGGVYAAGSAGSITGFRAGRMEPGFNGAIIIDDPIKPEDAGSKVKNNRINKRYSNTIKNRVALESVPIILIMQRVGNEDLSAFLLRGGSEEKWHHLDIPAIIQDKRSYPKDFKYGIPIDYDYPNGPLWDYKHSLEQLKAMKFADPYVFDSQYMQRPSAEGGTIFNSRFFKYYKSYNARRGYVLDLDDNKVKIKYKILYADTAMKAKETNDFSALQVWGKGENGAIYLLDSIRGKWESYDLREKFKAFANKHEFAVAKTAIGLRSRKVEDKASGTGLIQDLNKEMGDNYIEGIPRDIDKVSRARSSAPKIRQGLVHLPKDAFWVDEYISEFDEFTSMDTHRYDDQIDATMDAIHDMLIDPDEFSYDEAV